MQVVDITLENAQQLLIDESFNRPVVVDFWAEWCGPCKSLMPILDRLANEYQGAFLLAKVNADDQNMIAAQFGVRSLPTVMLIKDGQPLDGFTGAQTENFVRQMLAKHLPKPWEKTLQQARRCIDEKDFSAALPLLKQVAEESRQEPAVVILWAQTLLELNRIDEAETLLSTIKMAHQDAQYQQVLAQLQLKKQAAKTPEVSALELSLEKDPDNLDLQFQLAVQLSHEGYDRQALELLLGILQKNRNFSDGLVKKTMMDILAALGKADPLTIEYQRKLFTLLY
jgi:putative thioredoxin